jgi:3-deoxy-D-manno-octulosonate 8-phosphate phosphatase (KDO 8-P phosphatase)
MTLATRLSSIRLLLLDVDGVLTDGTILLHGDGTESKTFHIRDGSAIVLAQRAGLQVGLLSARVSDATAQRAAQLGIRTVVQGASNKMQAYEQILRDASLTDAEVAYMGDDLLDVPVLRRAGLPAVPADAPAEIRAHAAWVSASPGGRGAVREFVELILKSQRRWEDALQEFCGPV